MPDFFDQLARDNPILYRKHLKVVRFFSGSGPVLELGPAQGMFLHLMRQEGTQAWGMDSSQATVRHCADQGLKVVKGEGTRRLRQVKASSLGGFFTSNVVEHLEPKELVVLLDLACSRLKVGGKLALMTSNAHALGVHVDSFYTALDHRRLYPLDLLGALLKERGMDVVRAVEDEDTRAGGLHRVIVRRLRRLLVGPFFGPPEIYIEAVKTSRKPTPGRSHLTFRR